MLEILLKNNNDENKEYLKALYEQAEETFNPSAYDDGNNQRFFFDLMQRRR